MSTYGTFGQQVFHPVRPFGDYLAGVINGILTPVTVWLIYKTFQSQKDEFSSQEKQIHTQNSEMQRQTRIMQQQAFEQTFFTWHESYLKFFENIEVSVGDRNQWLQYLTTFPYRRISRTDSQGAVEIGFYQVYEEVKNRSLILFTEGLSQKYENLNGLISTLLGLMIWINKSEILDDDKKRHYFDIIKRGLGNFELRIIFFCGDV